MPIPQFTYTPPSVTVVSNGPLQTIQAGSPLKTILMLGTAPQGPDYPTLCSVSDALNLFGSPNNYTSVGYDLPLAIRLASIQRQPTANQAIQFLVCRAGVVRASTTVAGSGANTSQVWTLLMTATGGTFSLTFGTQTIAAQAYNIATATLQTNIQAMTNVGTGNILVTGTAGTSYTITAAGSFADLALPAMSLTTGTLTGGSASISITTPGVSLSQVWQLNLSPSATSGTFALQYGSAVTSNLSYTLQTATSANAATIQTALVAASFWNTGNATVVVNPGLVNSYWIIAAQAGSGALANQPLPTALTLNASALLPAGTNNALSVINYGISTGTAFVLQAIGPYAGTRGGTTGSAGGTGLAINVQGSGANVTSVSIYDITVVSAPVLKQQFLASAYNLSTTQMIANAINGANPLNSPYSIVQVSSIGSGSVTATSTGTLLSNGNYVQVMTGGSDGLGTTPSNDSNGTIALLLQESLWAYADYIYAGFDYAAVVGTISAHLTAALGQNQYRKAILGPKSGTLYSTLIAGPYTYVASYQSDRIVCIGHDSLYAISPVTGNQVILDGFYAAAAFAGLKAVGPTQETTTKFPISGFVSVAIPQDLVGTTNFLSQSQLNALASSGLLVFEQTLSDGLLRVRDSISTAPYAFTGGSGGVNGGVNVFSQFSMRDIDDAWSNAMVQALVPMLGRVFPSTSILQQAFTLACTSQAAQLGSTIVDYAISVSLNPATNQPTVTGNYTAPYPVLNITIPTAFTLG